MLKAENVCLHSQQDDTLEVEVTTLKKRGDFLRLSRGVYKGTPSFVVQCHNGGQDGAIRVGFTASKKVGNAVMRNTAKRRLRALARLILPQHAHSGYDYVLIARKDATATRNFQHMQHDLIKALSSVHKTVDAKCAS